MKDVLLLGSLKTEDLILKDAVIQDEAELKRVCDSWDDKELLEGSTFDNDYIRKGILEGDLPPIPNANQNQHRFKSISLDGKIIGLIEMYLGYPTNNVLWIGMLIIDKEYQSKGYAKEVIEFINNELKTTAYQKIGIGVYLKNWRGLNFWIKQGFIKINKMYGDKEYSEHNHAIIALMKEVK